DRVAARTAGWRRRHRHADDGRQAAFCGRRIGEPRRVRPGNRHADLALADRQRLERAGNLHARRPAICTRGGRRHARGVRRLRITVTEEQIMSYSRREFGKIALAGLPAAALIGRGESVFGWASGLPGAVAQAKPNSLIEGVQIGTITYSYRSMTDQSAQATLK